MRVQPDDIRKLSVELQEKTIKNRRHLHANPELSYKEFQTQAYVLEQLNNIGVSRVEKIADTGVIATIGNAVSTGKTIALRADMDALPIHEQNNVSYKSTNEGVMHACGHDVHTSSLLATAEILHNFQDQLNGSVRLLFQPAEEKAPGGAPLMMDGGALKNPDVQSIIGQHVMPFIDAGKVGFRKGIYMASADELYLKVKGKGGHGAMPERNIDPVVMAANIIMSLQQVVSRMANPKTPSVISFGKVIANGATNVIPDEVYIEGTFRTLDEKWRYEALNKMRKLAQSIAEGLGGKCEFEIVNGYPYLYNDEKLTESSKNAAVEYLGEENVLDLDIWMAAEDFAYYSHEIPACFYRLGTRNEQKGIISSVHTPTFDIDEDALSAGPGLMAWIAIKHLSND